jgi:methylphosphotriester-DNA--protein-cysteine methyltransferase
MAVLQDPTIRDRPRSHLSLMPSHASGPTGETARWRAVTARDASANTFVYGVRSTRIYCRPSCPARLARRANVEFFDTPTQAEAAGFRSCKRCTPHLYVGDDPRVRVIQQARDTIAATICSGQRPKLQELAAEANLTPSHFHRVFKKIAGVTPGQYARAMREQKNNREETYRSGLENEDDLAIALDFEDLNELTDLWQSQLDGVDVPEGNMSLEDLINWDEFDAMMSTDGLDAGELQSDRTDECLTDTGQTGLG